MLATTSMNPGEEASNLLNSSVYIVSFTHSDTEFDMKSECVGGDPYDWLEMLIFCF